MQRLSRRSAIGVAAVALMAASARMHAHIKPINGAQLLGLLENAGYHFRIDLAEARALAQKPL
jgi:hypothetical protein